MLHDNFYFILKFYIHVILKAESLDKMIFLISLYSGIFLLI